MKTLLSRKNLLKDSIVFFAGITLGGLITCYMVLAKLDAKEDKRALMGAHVTHEMEELIGLKQKTEASFQGVVKKIAMLNAQSAVMDAKLNAMAEHLKVNLREQNEDVLMSSYHLGAEQADLTLYAAMATLEYKIQQKAQQLAALEDLAQNKMLANKTKLAGQVQIVKGWLSSYYGTRTDPLTGNKKWHSGVDIGSHHGREVKSVATGVVTFAGEKGGYGNTLEISHGDGLLTRYGHNQDLLVKEGDIVHKGTPIALVGNTGRATGPHVHFEVREDGRAVDPAKYFPQFSRKT